MTTLTYSATNIVDYTKGLTAEQLRVFIKSSGLRTGISFKMGKLVLVLCFALVVGTGYALKCYTCNSQTVEGCTKDAGKLQETSCGAEHPNFHQFCLLKVVYDNQLKQDNILSGCEVTPKPATIDKNLKQCQPDNRYEVKDCKVCDTDLCNFINAAPANTASFFAIACLAGLYIINNFARC